MKTKIVLPLLLTILTATNLFSQKYFMPIYREFEPDDITKMDIVGIYDSIPLPGFIQKNLTKIKMNSSHYNILILRINDAVVHYNVLTQKLDTLFFVFHETEISKPVWSQNNDKVAFVIFNPEMKYGYKTPFRLIVLTLNNGKVLKKEKFNIESIDYDYMDVDDSVLFFKDEQTLTYSDYPRFHDIKLSSPKGYEPIKTDFTYILFPKKRYIYKSRYFYRNLDEYDYALVLHRYLVTCGKITDLITRKSVTWKLPKVKNEALQCLSDCAVSPDNSKLAVFKISDKTKDTFVGGDFLIYSLPDLKFIKKVPAKDITMPPADQYYIEFHFKTNNIICYPIFDQEKGDFSQKCIKI